MRVEQPRVGFAKGGLRGRPRSNRAKCANLDTLFRQQSERLSICKVGDSHCVALVVLGQRIQVQLSEGVSLARRFIRQVSKWVKLQVRKRFVSMSTSSKSFFPFRRWNHLD